MCVYTAITVQVMLRRMDSAAGLKSSGYNLESRLARHLDKGSTHTGGSPVCERTGLCTRGGNLQWGKI